MNFHVVFFENIMFQLVCSNAQAGSITHISTETHERNHQISNSSFWFSNLVSESVAVAQQLASTVLHGPGGRACWCLQSVVASKVFHGILFIFSGG